MGRGGEPPGLDLVGQREGTLPLEPLANRAAGELGHHVVDQVLSLPRVEHRQHVGMLEPCRDSNLPQEPLGRRDDSRVLLCYLDSHATIMSEIVIEEHHGHAAAAENVLNRVTVCYGATEPGQRMIPMLVSDMKQLVNGHQQRCGG